MKTQNAFAYLTVSRDKLLRRSVKSFTIFSSSVGPWSKGVLYIPVDLFIPDRSSYSEARDAALSHLTKMAKCSKFHKECLWLWNRDNPANFEEHVKNFNRPHFVLRRMKSNEILARAVIS